MEDRQTPTEVFWMSAAAALSTFLALMQPVGWLTALLYSIGVFLLFVRGAGRTRAGVATFVQLVTRQRHTRRLALKQARPVPGKSSNLRRQKRDEPEGFWEHLLLFVTITGIAMGVAGLPLTILTVVAFDSPNGVWVGAIGGTLFFGSLVVAVICEAAATVIADPRGWWSTQVAEFRFDPYGMAFMYVLCLGASLAMIGAVGVSLEEPDWAPKVFILGLLLIAVAYGLLFVSDRIRRRTRGHGR